MLYAKFGEFNSVEELNRAAAAQKAEGDEEALVALAVENGIDREDAEDYMDDCIDELATTLSAAIGKLKVEKEEYNIKGVLSDWVDELVHMCTEDDRFCKAVRSKGKDLAGYIALTAESGYKNRAVVDPRIVTKTTSIKNIVGNHEFSIGIPDKKTRRELAKEYYLLDSENCTGATNKEGGSGNESV